MGKKTHGPYLISAIEKNDHQKVHEILAKEIKNKEKIREICTSSLRRLASEHSEVPLLLAAQLPDPSIIQYMVGNHHVDINFVLKEQIGRKQKIKSALIMAVRRGMYDTVEAILAMNADPNIQDHKGRSALHHAVRKADYRMAKMLVVRGAQASLTDKGDNTPLHVASIFGHVELAKMLIYYGADLYKKGQLGAIPIHIAAKEGHVGLLKLFCQHDVNPNIKMPCYDGREKAALHVAAEEGHFECVNALVDLGADINLGDSEGETPLHCAVLHEYDPMGMKSKEDYTETLKVIIKSGGNVNNQNGRGETALHLASRNQFQKSVEVLLQAGGDPLIEDNSGDKPIDLVDEDDAVSRQILKQVMENREHYMNDLFELKAKGYSTSANPLTSKSLSMDMLSSKESLLGKAASTLGLVNVYPKPSVSSYPGEDEYLRPLDSRHNLSSHSISAEIHPVSSDEGKRTSPENTYAKIDDNQQNAKPVPDLKKGKDTNLPKFLKGKQTQESLLERKASMLESSDSSHYDEENKLKNTPNKLPKVTNGVMKIEAVKRVNDNNVGRSLPTPPESTVRESIMSTSTDMTDMSSVWEVTPHASVSGRRDFGVAKTTGDLMTKLKQDLATRQQAYSDYTTTQYETLPDENQTRVLKGLSTFAPEPEKAPPVPKTLPPTQAPKTGTQMVYENEHSESDDDDTFFDDESFDTMDTISEATVEMVDKNKEKVQSANKELYSPGDKNKPADSHVQNWLTEQATLLIHRNFGKDGGPIAQSTPPSSRVNYSGNTLDAPSDMYENLTSVSEQAAKNRLNLGSKIPKTGRPVPPPRPPKRVERTSSTSSIDSLRRPPPPEPKHNVKKKTRTKSESSDGGGNVVHLEVDDKEPGQTVIRILPVQNKPAIPKKKPHLNKDINASKLSSDNVSNLLLSSGSKKPSSFDTESEVSTFSKSSSKVKRKPSQRIVVDRSGISRHNTANSFIPLSKGRHNQSEDSFDVDSIFTQNSDDEQDEEPNTGHYTVKYFEHVKQDDFRNEEKTEEEPLSPSTPKIKMTFGSKEPHNKPSSDVNKKLEEKPLKTKKSPENETVKKSKKDLSKDAMPPVIKPLIITNTTEGISPRPAIRPKPQPRNVASVPKVTEIIQPGPKSPVPKPRVQNEPVVNSQPDTDNDTSYSHDTSDISQSTASMTQGTVGINQAKPNIIKDSQPKTTTNQEHDVKTDRITKTNKLVESQPAMQVSEEKTININNNEEKKITQTKKKVKKKGTKSKTKSEKEKTIKTATIKIEKVEKPEPEEVATKPDVHHYAVVNKEAKDKSKIKPSVAEDTDTSSNSHDSKDPPLPPVKLIDPYETQESVKSPVIKLEDPYATVSVVDEIITANEEDPLPPNVPAQSKPAYEPPPPVPQALPEKSLPVTPTQLEKSPKTRKVTIGSKQFIPNHRKRPKDHDHRKIVYVCGGQVDFDIIGGNADGVFVYNIHEGSNAENAGLQIGDKLLKVNEQSVIGKTKEEVYLILKGIKNVLDMVVKFKYDRYKSLIDSGGLGDSFHIRSHINYRAQRNGEMNISSGDIFLIQDTLPNGQFGYWRASKLNAGPREQQHGLIPNLQKAEQIGLDTRMAQLKELEKEKGGFLKRGFKRSKSLDRSAMKLAKSQEDLSLNARNKIAYERIEHKAADFPRPVFLLGLFSDVVRDMLARESPGMFLIPTGDIEQPTTNSSGGIDPVNIATLKNIILNNKHCLTIVTPKGIEFLQKTDLNPMVIYLAPGHKSILKTVKNKLAPMYEKKIGYLYDESMAFERHYDHLFTASVSYTSDDSWFSLLKDTIHRIQNQPQWQAVKESTKPETNDSDEEESDDDDGNMLNRSLDNIPGQLESLLSRNNVVTGSVNNQYHDSPVSDHSAPSTLNKPTKSILKKDKFDYSANSSQISDTESSSSSVSRTNIRPSNTVGHLTSSPNQYNQQANQQRPSVNQYAEPSRQHYPSTSQYSQQPTHPPQHHQDPPVQQRVDKPGPAMLGFHPALQSQAFNPPPPPVQTGSSKETVL